MSVRVEHGDCLQVMRALADEGVRVDAVVSDPPYHFGSIVKRFAKSGGADRPESKVGAYTRHARGFMGKAWDGGDIALRAETWALAAEVMKPGAHLVAFGGTRTFHRMAVAIEDAGFEIRDTLFWLYASGFPKSHNITKALDGKICACENPEPTPERYMRSVFAGHVPAPKHAGDECGEVLFSGVPKHSVPAAELPQSKEGREGGAERELEGRRDVPQETRELRSGQVREMPAGVRVDVAGGRVRDGASACDGEVDRPPAAPRRGRASRGSQAAQQRADKSRTLAGQSQSQDGGAWPRCGRCGKPIVSDGLGTALKPAVEPIILARKPLAGTVAANVLRYGTGAINIDGCRIGTNGGTRGATTGPQGKVYGDGLNGDFGVPVPGLGRWPANVLHDGSEEVLEAFAAYGERQSGGVVKGHEPSRTGENGIYGKWGRVPNQPHHDSGSAARFFFSAKADADDRIGSKHPTVKPVSLMRWLVRLVTPKGGLVLDPFAGTGTTGVACIREGMDAILIEREAEYHADIQRRLAMLSGLDTPLLAGAAE